MSSKDDDKHKDGFNPQEFDLGIGDTGKWKPLESTMKFSRTGRFRRMKTREPTPTEMEEHTKKIIIFPVEEAEKLHQQGDPPPRKQKPPIQFTAPLPKVQHLPEDFFELGELEELPQDEYTNSQSWHGDDLDFPQEDKKLSDIIRNLENIRDRYAENMFSQEDKTDWDEISRLERLIPGTDREEGKRIAPSRERIKVPKIHPPPPDMPPRILEQKLSRFRLIAFFRRIALLILFALSCILAFAPFHYGGEWEQLEYFASKVQALGYLLALGMVLSLDLLLRGLWRGFLLKAGTDTLGMFLGIFCGLDCFLQYTSPNPREQLPLVPLVLLQYLCLAYGEECKRRGHSISCSVASKVSEPCILSTESNKWQNRNTYSKSTDSVKGFSSQIQEEDGVSLCYSIIAPVSLVMSFCCAWVLTRNTQDFVWAISSFLLVSTPVGAGFLYGRTMLRQVKQLKNESYSTLAGWPAVARKTKQCVLTDCDLFPKNFIRITGASEYNGHSQKKVMSYTATLLKAGEVGCSSLFQDMMVSRGQSLHKCRDIRFHDGGGISGKIAMDTVTVGGASFTTLMDVEIPEGLFVNNGIFCSVNGELAGFFAIEYSLHEMVEHSLENLLYEGIRPILATRDFALTPEILKHRFHLPTGKMDFPSVNRRYELSNEERQENSVITAVITRESILALSDCIIAAKRLRQGVLTGLAVCLSSSILGFFLVAYLVSSTAYNALSPDNLMIYLLLWLAPIWLISELTQR